MIWKIYAWLYTAINLIGVLVLITSIGSWNISAWEGSIESVVLSVGVLSFSYQKVLLKKEFWKFIFTIILIVWVATPIISILEPSYRSILKSSTGMSNTQALLSILFSIPAMMAIYKMGFPKTTPASTA